jgi:hypothetical protein
MPVPRSRASHAPAVGGQTRKTLGASPPDAGCALSRAYPLRQRVTVMLATVAVLPDSLRACWAAWRSTALLQSAAVADAVVLVEAAGAVVVVAGAAVEDGALAVLFHQSCTLSLAGPPAQPGPNGPWWCAALPHPLCLARKHIRWVHDWKPESPRLPISRLP